MDRWYPCQGIFHLAVMLISILKVSDNIRRYFSGYVILTSRNRLQGKSNLKENFRAWWINAVYDVRIP